MEISCYLAMTAGELEQNGPPADRDTAYMACHFSPYGTGLSNLPRALPPGAMLIVNDRTPVCGHDPQLIARQLCEQVRQLECGCVLLDFQRPGEAVTRELCRVLEASLPCPVGTSELYAAELTGPVFLPPVPPDRPLKEYLAPWQHREIWLEAALDSLTLSLTEEGCAVSSGGDRRGEFADEALHCHYGIEIRENEVRFLLHRTRDDLEKLLEEAGTLGVSRAVGLWQELNYSVLP